MRMGQNSSKGFWPDLGTLALAMVPFGIAASKAVEYALKAAESRSLAIAGLCVFLGSQLAAVVLGVLALCGVGRREGRADVWRAIVAIVLGGLFLVCVPVGFWSMRRLAQAQKKVAQKKRQKETEEIERNAVDSLMRFPGWSGSGEAFGATIGVASMDDRSPSSRELNSYLRADISLLQLAVGNVGGADEVTLDLSSVRLILADGSQKLCLSPVAVLNTAKEDKDRWVARFSGPLKVAPGQELGVGMAFFPRGTDFSAVQCVMVTANDREVRIRGAFYGAAERERLYRLGQELQRAADQ